MEQSEPNQPATDSISGEQIKLFRSIFSGRDDVYGVMGRREPLCKREALTDALLLKHFHGGIRIGRYGLAKDGTVRWAIIDIDELNLEKVEKVIVACIGNNLFPYPERSREKGYHVWIFFDYPIKAKDVRKILTKIVKQADAGDCEIFPKQDVLSSNNGVGNFVFLPLHGASIKQNRTVFLNGQFEPYEDQWTHLSKIRRTKVENILSTAGEINEREVDPSDFDSILPEIKRPQTREFQPQKCNERLEKIMQCEFLRHCDKDQASLPETQWYAAMSIIPRENGGVELAHQLSQGYPGYSREETDQKILHAMNDAGPATCQRIKTLWDCGRDCGVTSPIQLGHKEVSPQTAGSQSLSYSSLHLPTSFKISQLEIRVDWVVKNLIPKESITLLHSIGGVGKTYLMYGIAQAVADGRPFFGLNVIQMNVYYIDFENPIPEIVDRMKKIGGSENMRIWHLGHTLAPIRFDADDWEVYKTFPPGLFIIDSLRSSHLLDENSSKDAAFIMARHKAIRALGSTIVLIHHENKLGGYRGSTAWFDLSDHILKFSRVKKIGSDEDAEADNFDLPIRLGVGGKSRFSSAMELNPMYFKFEDHRLCRVDDPDDPILRKMAQLLDPQNPPCRAEFEKLVKDNLGYKRKVFDRLVKVGEKRNLWVSRKIGDRNKLGFYRIKNGAF